jgi:hypothetical protein
VSKKLVRILLVIASGLALASCGGGKDIPPMDDCLHRPLCDLNGRPINQ